MKLTYRPYTLQMKRPFGLASGTRSTTPIVLVELEHKGMIGYGEASLPPYYPETQESVMQFLSLLNLAQFEIPLDIEAILKYTDQIAPSNNAAKASVDIALHDLVGKLENVPCRQLFPKAPAQLDNSGKIQEVAEYTNPLPFSHLDPNERESRRGPYTCYTIAIDHIASIAEKIKEAEPFKILKIKLGTAHDKEIIKAVSQETDKAIYADANQGWKSKEHALEILHLLKDQGYVMVEQPMPIDCLESDMAWLKENSPLPLLADESVKRLPDMEKAAKLFHGVNIKLMKSTGMAEAYKIILKARELNMQVMVGCMTETSCAIMAAAQLSHLADYVDLDGAFLISNNPFKPPVLVDGRVLVSTKTGIGVEVIR